MPVGRPSELDGPRSVSLNIRLHEAEREAIARAAYDAGLAISEWSRAMLVTAAGSSQLLGQLARIEPSLEERLDAFRRRRLPEIAAGRNTPLYTPYVPGQRQPSKRARYERAVVVHLAPQRITWPPPPRHISSTAETIAEFSRMEHELAGALLPRGFAPDRAPWTVIDDGYLLPSALAWDGLDGTRSQPPCGFARLHRNGFVETVLTHRLDEERITAGMVEDIRRVIASQIAAIPHVGGLAPLSLAISLLGVQGFSVAVRRHIGGPLPGTALYPDEIFLPIVTAPAWDVDARDLLRRPLDELWQMGGHARCEYLDDPLPERQ